MTNIFKNPPKRNEIEAMTIIINIQMMQNKIYGSSFEHSFFEVNTIDELRTLQSDLLIQYNKTVKPCEE